MQHVEKSIEVDASLNKVYNQWTQFEEFPQFMEGIEEVKQLDDKRLLWRANIAGKTKEWHAEIFEQIPDQRIAWRSTSGVLNTGMVNFESVGPGQTRIHLKLNFEPEGAIENLGSALGVVGSRVEGDLRRFKDFIESRGSETGAWRGQIHGRKVDASAAEAETSMPRSKRLHGEV
ncbi:MAG: SRPBCC family protein [Verrucomicrobiales bacterium]